MIQVIDYLTAGATLMMAFLIFSNPRGVNKKANLWLSVFVFCVFAQMVEDLLYTQKIFHQYPHLIGFGSLCLFLIPPTLYLAVLHYVSPGKDFQLKDLLHFVLFALYVLLFLSKFFFLPIAEKRKVLVPTESNWQDYLIFSTLLLQLFVYLGLSILKINRHQLNIQLVLSSEEQVNLLWLKYFLISFFFMGSMYGLTIFVIPETPAFELSASIIYFILVFLLAYNALHQVEIYSFDSKEKKEIQELIEENAASAELKKKQYLSQEVLQEMTQKLAALMETEKPYLDNELNLPKLAKILDTSIHVLSYVINEGHGENFSQFINRYRVEEAKKLLINPEVDNLNMLGIAFQAGFNSKTAFNTAFKKTTGQSPTEYKNGRIEVSQVEGSM